MSRAILESSGEIWEQSIARCLILWSLSFLLFSSSFWCFFVSVSSRKPSLGMLRKKDGWKRLTRTFSSGLHIWWSRRFNWLLWHIWSEWGGVRWARNKHKEDQAQAELLPNKHIQSLFDVKWKGKEYNLDSLSWIPEMWTTRKPTAPVLPQILDIAD